MTIGVIFLALLVTVLLYIAASDPLAEEDL